MAVSLTTEDKLEYNFYPVTAGQIQFRVKAANDAHVALTTGPQEGEPMYEVFIGGWSNSKSVIRKNRAKPDVAEMETPGILNGDDYSGFWIRWDDGNLTVGKEGESAPFMSYVDPEPFGISYFGVCTGWGATGDWLIEAICCGGFGGCHRNSLNTPNNLQYQFHAVRGGSVLIDVKAKSNGHIALTGRKGESSPMYEIMLGGWDNMASVIRYDRKQPDKVRVDTPNLLSEHEHKRFSITWFEGLITVRTGGQNGAVLMKWHDPNPIGVSYVGVRTAWGATGNWKLRFEHYPAVATTAASGRKHPDATPSAPMEVRGVDAGSECWCDASGGMVPPGAVEGGNDGETLFVGRARHEGALIPGKVKPGHCVCYVAWGGAEHGKTEYQVLCGCNPVWVTSSGGDIPQNAIPGGETEDGEPLFIGRVHHEGTLTIGKVQPSHNVCYIPFAGSEVAFPEYEILVSQ